MILAPGQYGSRNKNMFEGLDVKELHSINEKAIKPIKSDTVVEKIKTSLCKWHEYGFCSEIWIGFCLQEISCRNIESVW